MNQCLRCNQLCSSTSTFCSLCQSSLLKTPQQQCISYQAISPLSSPAFEPAHALDKTESVQNSVSSLPSPVIIRQSQSQIPRRISVAFLALAILAAGALIVDSILVLAVFQHLPDCSAITDESGLNFFIGPMLASSTKQAAQQLHLHTSSNCQQTTSWNAIPENNWLSVIPATGKLQPAMTMLIDVIVAGSQLAPGCYVSKIVFVSPHATHVIPVRVLVQRDISSPAPSVVPKGSTRLNPTATPALRGPAPFPPDPPVLALSSTSLAFSVTEGQANPPGQSLTLLNIGSDVLIWQTAIQPGNSWLALTPMHGTLPAQQAAQMNIATTTTNLLPGTYSSKVIISPTNTARLQGKSQVFSVKLTVFQHCTLQVMPTSLSFTSSIEQPDQPAQNITLQFEGNCSLPVSGKATVDPASCSWLPLPTSSGSSARQATFAVSVGTEGLLPGTFHGQITISIVDNSGAILSGSPQIIAVTLTIMS